MARGALTDCVAPTLLGEEGPESSVGCLGEGVAAGVHATDDCGGYDTRMAFLF